MNKLFRLVRYDWPLHFALLFTNWLPDNIIFMRLRGWLISPFFKRCGKNLRVGRNCTFGDSYRIEIGSNVYIAYGNWIMGSTDVTIDDEVMFGPSSIVISGNHVRQNGSFRYGPNQFSPIHIGYGSWIGGNCAILAGAKVGKGSVVAANSVLNKEMPDNAVIAGAPAKFIKEIVE